MRRCGGKRYHRRGSTAAPRRGAAREQSEFDIENTIIDALTAAGFIVMKGGSRVTFGSTGADRGHPDLSITHPTWPSCLWCLLEVKKPKGSKVSAEQNALLESGRTVLVTSVPDAVRAVQAVHREFGPIEDSHITFRRLTNLIEQWH